MGDGGGEEGGMLEKEEGKEVTTKSESGVTG